MQDQHWEFTTKEIEGSEECGNDPNSKEYTIKIYCFNEDSGEPMRIEGTVNCSFSTILSLVSQLHAGELPFEDMTISVDKYLIVASDHSFYCNNLMDD